MRQVRQIPEAIRSLTPLNYDYSDLFVASVSDAAERSPETWARALVVNAAGTGGQFVWRVLLRLRPKRSAAAEEIGGYAVAARGDRWIRLEASSWLVTAHIVVQVENDHVSVGSFLRYNSPIAKAVWLPIAAGHRQVMPRLLRHAARVVRRSV